MARVGVRRVGLRVLGVVVLVAPCFAACAYDRDAFYEPAASQALPFLPFTPDAERVDECAACAEESCAPEREACLAEPECVELLRCRGECSNPRCLADCGERTHLDVVRFGYPEQDEFDAYEECVSRRACGAPCGWGQNWGCVGHYTWPLADDPAHLPLELEIRNLGDSHFHATHLSACSSGSFSECDLLDETDADSWGQASLDVGSTTPRTRDGFTGYLEIDFGGEGVALYFPGVPVYRPARIVAVLAPPGPLDPLFTQLDPRFALFASPAPYMALVAIDCLGAMAPGVEFELLGGPPSAVRYYLELGGLPSFDATQTMGSFPSGGFAGLDTGLVSVRARLAASETTVASRDSVRVTAGLTVVILVPNVTGGE